MKIFILAAGKCERWNGQTKHLADINGETVLGRTIRMLGSHDYTIVTGKQDIMDIFPGKCFRPANNERLIDTILSTKELWSDDRILFMLGDVVWTSNALKLALCSEEPIEFFASDQETFAISVSNENKDDFVNACHAILSDPFHVGSTWELYRQIACIPLDKHWMDTWYHHRISDKTDDIDYPEDYKVKVDSGYFKDMQ